ncbi:macrolide family glycosyltransferase [Streptomyces sp. NBC_00091]|uniref:macrolide family glycosyltransferase n=1 Tax=Streptomyces sp. NBC_00091 TaxID=2975648 RepID=UPI0022512369|nr:macrolide family glycosyltransferase [Streptomyces sp. NBC_00091]MCX5381161.1 glycosyltransferase [Streptomyces sp. NBC_00091]
MAHIAFFILPAAGHVNPTLSVARELVARGHRVSYALSENYGERVLATGAEFLPYPMDQERFLETMVPQQDSASYTDQQEFLNMMKWMLELTQQTLPPFEAHFADDRPDVFVCDPSSFWSGHILAAKWGIPVIRSTPTYVANEHWSLHPPVDTAEEQQEDPETGELFGVVAGLLAEHGVEKGIGEFADDVHSGPALVYLPRAFQYAGETFGEEVNFVGPCTSANSFHGDWQAPQTGRPLALITLGTLYNKQPSFFRACVEAFADLDWDVVIAHAGGVAEGELGEVPAHIQVHTFVPQGEVLAHATLMINHGGTSTVLQAVSEGVPVISVPQMAELHATATRVEQLGVGAKILRKDISPELIRETVLSLAGDEDVRAAVARLREQIESAGGPGAAADAVERLLAPVPAGA